MKKANFIIVFSFLIIFTASFVLEINSAEAREATAHCATIGTNKDRMIKISYDQATGKHICLTTLQHFGIDFTVPDRCGQIVGLYLTDKSCQPTPSRDTDGDGFNDERDRCPQEASIYNNGCPRDTDGDGFNDERDRCPQEASRSNNGCPPPPPKPRFPTVLTIGDETNQSFVNGYLKTTNGTPLSQQQITLNINYDDTNKNYKHPTKTDSSGKFSHYFKYPDYVDVQAIFSGSANYEPSRDNRISEDDLGLDKLKIEMDNLLLAFGSEGFIIVTIVIITIIAAIFKRKIRNWVKVIMKYIPKIYPRKPSPPPSPFTPPNTGNSSVIFHFSCPKCNKKISPPIQGSRAQSCLYCGWHT